MPLNEKGEWIDRNGIVISFKDCVCALQAGAAQLVWAIHFSEKVKDDPSLRREYDRYVDILNCIKDQFYAVDQAQKQKKVKLHVPHRK